MKKGRVLCTAVLVSLMTGCASTPPPELPRSGYVEFSRDWVNLHRCIEQGNLSPEIGALGVRYMNGYITDYRRDVAHLQDMINQRYNTTKIVPTSTCNVIASHVAQRKQQIDIHNAQVDQNRQDLQNSINQINNNRPVICNQVGTYTMCQ